MSTADILTLAREAVAYGPPVVDDSTFDFAEALLQAHAAIEAARSELARASDIRANRDKILRNAVAILHDSAASTGKSASGSPSPLVADGLTEAAVHWLRRQLDGCIEYADIVAGRVERGQLGPKSISRALVDDLRDARKALG